MIFSSHNEKMGKVEKQLFPFQVQTSKFTISIDIAKTLHKESRQRCLSLGKTRLVKMYFVPFFFSFLHSIAPYASATYNDQYFPGHVQKTISNVDWIGCLQACHDEPRCTSYNYFKENETCEINSNGIKDQCETKSMIFSKGWIFHQLRVSAICEF